MGRIRRLNDENSIILCSQTLIGRDPLSSLVLERTSVSALHARIFWSADVQCWTIEAVDSTNGTYIRKPPRDFVRLPAGQRGRQRITEGDQMLFGERDEIWELEDATSPFPEAVEVGARTRVAADGGVLLLPSPHEARVAIYVRDLDGTYVVDAVPSDEDAGPVPLRDRRIEVAGRRFDLYFDVVQPTARPIRGDLQHGYLEYAATRQGSSLVYVEGRVRLQLGAYTCYGVVGRLAAARADDLSKGRAPEEAGWRPRSALHVRGNGDAVTQEMWRCQQQLTTAGLRNVERLFEKQQGRGWVRLGVDVRLIG